METLPNTWLARFNAAARPRLARWSGFLFSLGHGLVVMAVAVAVGIAAQGWQAPAWLEGLGAWISILFPAALGWVNLRAVVQAPAHQVVPLAGIKGRWLGRFTRTNHPLLVAGFGLAKLLAPPLAAATDGLELAFGAAVVATVAASYIVALKLSPQPG